MNGKLISLLLIPLLLGCQEQYRLVDDNSLEKDANIKISNFYRQSLSREGKKEWEISAGEAYIFLKRKETTNIIAYNFNFNQFDDKSPAPLANIKAVRGEVNYEENRLYLTGDVVYRSRNGRTITAARMEYDRNERIVSSTVPVLIVEKGLTTKCKGGIVVEEEINRQLCREPEGSFEPQPESEGDEEEESIEGLFQ